ncbi:hypothetical protein NLG97_g4050 [Lecanicillium saksenae]|uniref:Uncharacterized protein n=1 Tax=Lecanicillium saksenae TaxID=468837 RepID=A0ACC1R0A0_9HYPO|nr:hypothetical protein NLG97_g4050 [Lecanicillium saksenae]
MQLRYAKNQPVGFTNRIQNVAIVGATGQLGKFVISELLKSNGHKITALTRFGNQSALHHDVKQIPVDYDDEMALVSALQGQQLLIIILAVSASSEVHSRIVKAAGKANVPYIMPNSYGEDIVNSPSKANLLPVYSKEELQEIEEAGSSWILMVCNLWYEYSLAMGPIWFGFDFAQKKLTLYDDGNTKVNVTTWEQCGRAIAGLAGLKELPEDEWDVAPTVSGFCNKPLYVSSFRLSQKDMLQSWKRVTGDRDEDWEVENENSQERFDRGIAMMKSDNALTARMGAGMASFVRMFFPGGDSNYKHTYALHNDSLGLPKESLDERTAFAKKLVDEGYSANLFKRAAAEMMQS